MSFDIYQTVKDFLHENPKYVTLYLFLSLTFPLNQVALPYYYGKVIEDIPKTANGNIWKKSSNNFIIIISLWLISQLLNSSLDKLDTVFIPQLSSYIRKNVVMVIIKSMKGHYKDPEVGELISKVIKLPFVIRDIFHQIRSFLMPALLVLIFAIGFMFYVDPTLGLIAFFSILIFISMLYAFSQKCFSESKKTEMMSNHMYEEISDLFSNVLHVFSFDQLEHEVIRLEKIQENHDKQYRKTLNCSANFKMLFNATYFTFFIGLSAYAFNLYSKKIIDVGKLTSVIIILLYVVNQMEVMSSEIRDFVGNLGVVKNIQDDINQMEKIINKTAFETENFKPNTGEIFIKDLNIDFPQFLLHIDDLHIHNGEHISIGGSIGSGKSTLIQAIMKYIPYEGEITIGDQNISKVEREELRRYITYIPQQPKLFNRSIYENIIYGSKVNDIETVKRLIRDLDLHQLPIENLNRLVGKNGSKLSGGQRQIVYFLRFLMRDATPIVILDEPTSALDSQTRDTILKILDVLLKDKTAIIITHDPIVVEKTNKHIILDKGKIIDTQIIAE